MRKQKIGEQLKQINCAMQKYTNNELREQDLTFAQIHLLFTLKYQTKDYCCSLKELERYMGVAQSTTVGIVKRCGEKGFVECIDDKEDRRAKFVRITDGGLEVLRNTEANIRRAEQRMQRYLTPEERETLPLLLDKVYRGVVDPE